jgi:hypothetical protein
MFDLMLRLIEDHPTFLNNSTAEQVPVSYQLAIALYHFGRFGNGGSVEAVSQWAGCSVGTVVKAMWHVIVAVLPLHGQAIHWPTMEEKQEASQWVE